MIEFIEINKIHPHPNNPRKDLGDLSELAESIKVSGILQNLTVVPWYSQLTGCGCDDPKQQEEMGYIVVIGHRRLAAAKLAGLTEVPCTISDMDKNTQIATMLLENMQRSDLTVWEQAQGFQMMLDLGETVTNISEKTGFSETTVRRRVKLLELDKDKFKVSAERGATLMDYAELEKIQDIELRNKVLESIGTPNFRYQLQNAIDTEKRETFNAKAVEFLETFATKAENSSGLYWYRSISSDNDLIKPDDADTVEYYYTKSNAYISLYRKNPKHGTQTYQPDPKEQERQERIHQLNKVSDMAHNLRHEFINNLSYTAIKKKIKDVITFVLYVVMNDNYFDCDDLYDVIGVEEDEEIEDFKDIEERIKEPEKVLLLTTYRTTDNNIKCYNWQGDYSENQELNRVYKFLEVMGYEISDEEKALRDGTHELFNKEND